MDDPSAGAAWAEAPRATAMAHAVARRLGRAD
jgi:hypothetical protein